MMLFHSQKQNSARASSNRHSSHSTHSNADSQFSIADISKPVDDWIGRNPAVCVGVALVLGVTIGCLVKRR